MSIGVAITMAAGEVGVTFLLVSVLLPQATLTCKTLDPTGSFNFLSFKF